METKELITDIIHNAIDAHTSDIFLLPKVDKYLLKLRNNQGVEKRKEFTLNMGSEIVNFFKYSAQMDISEHRRPQVGAMTVKYNNQEYYLRLSSLGDFNNRESLAIRIIYQINDSKYFFDDQITRLRQLSFKRGLIITSGPTGSGKTTTMYELAKQIGTSKVVMTIEDPVEVHEESFLQTQVNDEAGIDYQNLLKAALRHRPDILIIGEIRDRGTARLAIDAALSGHLVLATVHAKSTLQTISRLEGLGIKNAELTNCLTGISYQRLLPIKESEQIACLLDVADGNLLKESIMKTNRKDFINWHENMQILKEKGQISDGTYQMYKEG